MVISVQCSNFDFYQFENFVKNNQIFVHEQNLVKHLQDLMKCLVSLKSDITSSTATTSKIKQTLNILKTIKKLDMFDDMSQLDFTGALKGLLMLQETFQLDPKEFIEVEKTADQLGIQILGVMHSHTASRAYPSETDVRDANQFDPFGLWYYIILTPSKR